MKKDGGKLKGGVFNKMKRKHLIAALLVLCAIILVLVVSIVLVQNFNSGQEGSNIEEPVAGEEIYEPTEEDVAREDELVAECDRINAEVEKLLAVKPVNVNAINELYAAGIEKALQYNRSDYVIALALQREENFRSGGLKKEALDAWQTLDFDLFSDPDKYRLYSYVTDLAQELNDQETLDKYNALRDTVEAAYWEDYEATSQRAEKENEDLGEELNDGEDE